MPNLFGRSGGPFDEAVDKICDIGNEADDWQLIMNLCDSVNTTTSGCKLMMKALLKKIKNADASQMDHAATLLDACVNNCNRPFHLELCARENLNELKQYLQKNRGASKGVTALKEAMVKWAKAFGEDPQLYLLSVTITNLKGDDVTFPSEAGPAPPVNLPAPASKSCQNEEEMIKKAIEMSLKEAQSGRTGQGSAETGSSAIYPTFTADKPLDTDRNLFMVKALYDFEAAEENEITFKAGDLVSVTDNADQNWWKGRTQISSGLFPANFVTKDIRKEPSPPPPPEPVKITEVNPQQIELLLEMLRKADATVTNEEEDQYIAELEESVGQQESLVLAEYDMLKAQHTELESVNDDMSRVVGLFHKLLKEAPPIAPVQAPQPIRYASYPAQEAAPEQQQYAPRAGGQFPQYANYPSQSPPPSYNPPSSHPNQPQPSHPQHSHPQSSHPQPPHPAHTQPSHPQPSHPQPSHPQPSHPQHSHPQPSHPHPGPPPNQYYHGYQGPPDQAYSQPMQYPGSNIAHVTPVAQSGASNSAMQ